VVFVIVEDKTSERSVPVEAVSFVLGVAGSLVLFLALGYLLLMKTLFAARGGQGRKKRGSIPPEKPHVPPVDNRRLGERVHADMMKRVDELGQPMAPLERLKRDVIPVDVNDPDALRAFISEVEMNTISLPPAVASRACTLARTVLSMHAKNSPNRLRVLKKVKAATKVPKVGARKKVS
jgi:hypothetical protein